MTTYYSVDCVDLALRDHSRRLLQDHKDVVIRKEFHGEQEVVAVHSTPPHEFPPAAREFWFGKEFRVHKPYEPQPGEFSCTELVG